MKIVEYAPHFNEKIKDLLVELQEYIVEIDKDKLSIISEDYREKYFEKTLKETQENNGKIFVAVQENEVVGMIACHIFHYDEFDKLDYSCPKKGIISELIVSKLTRNSGVGKLLITHAENHLKSQNCECVQLEVFAYNESGKNFYKKQGYGERCLTLFKNLKKD